MKTIRNNKPNTYDDNHSEVSMDPPDYYELSWVQLGDIVHKLMSTTVYSTHDSEYNGT
jgi:hypothetical protein